MKKIIVVYMLSFFVLMLSSVNLAQEPITEPSIIFELRSEYGIRDLDWNFDSGLLAYVGGGEEVTVVNVETGETEVIDFAGERIAWNNTNNFLLIANQITRLLDYDEKTLVNGFEFPMEGTENYTPVGNVDWHPTQDIFTIVLFSCEDGTNYRPGARIEVWNVETSTFTPIAGCLWTSGDRVKWSPTGTQIAVNGAAIFDRDGFIVSEQIEVWDVNTAEKILAISDLRDPSGLVWNHTGDQLAFTTIIERDRYIQVWDIANNELLWQATSDVDVYGSLDWHPTENFIVTGGQFGSVRIWNALTGAELIELPVHEDTVFDVSWSPDGSMLASAGRDGKLFIWDISGLFESEP